MKENQTPTTQQAQREILEALGSHLRQTRIAQSIPLEEVAQKTYISTRLLNAIEEGNLEVLPEAIYTKGLIKRFADAVGLDGTQLASEFPTEAIFPSKKRFFRLRLPAAQLRPFHLYLIYVLLVVGTVNALSYLVQRSGVEMGSSENSEQTIEQLSTTSEPTPTSQQQTLEFEAVKQSSSQKQDQAEQDVTLKVKITSQCWLRVVADGKTAFEGVLPAGTERTWSAKEKVTLRAGNAGGVVVTFNNEEQQLGKPGQVEEVTYRANSGV